MRKTHQTHRMKLFGIDDMLIGGIIGGLGSIFTNTTNKQNVEDTNRQNAANVAASNAMNLQIAREGTQFNKEEAQRSRDYQERLSNSAYQRTMADMASAGLNPILAYQKGGASTPSGAQGSALTTQMQSAKGEAFHGTNIAGEAVNTALSLRRANQENENMKFTADNIQAQTAKTHSDTVLNHAKTAILGEDLSPAQLRKIVAEQDKSVYRTTAGELARKSGTLATEAERTVSPILNSAKSVSQTFAPWKSYKNETTRSGSSWKDKLTGENHYEDTTFSNRFKGW